MEHDEHLTADSVGEQGHPLDAAGPERRCILTQAHGPRASLIRLAVGPDNQVAPDFAGKLPGRGAWIVADRVILEAALDKGKLKGALARAFKSNSLKLPDDLADTIAAGLERRALDRLGLENRAGHLIWGHERIGEALLKGKIRLLIHAADAKPDGMGKLEARRRGASPDTASLILPVGRDRLSLALGRENVVHAAISDAASATRVMEAVGRWAAFGRTAGDGAAITETAGAGRHEKDDEAGVAAVAVAAGERH
jgi:uncharacterized protein